VIQYVIQCVILPRDAMHKRGLCCRPRPSVRRSVLPYICHVGALYPDCWRIVRLLFRPGSRIIRVFDSERRYPIPSGTYSALAGVGKFAIFDWNRRLSRKRYEIGPWLPWNVNRKSYAADRSVSVPVTLSGRNPCFKVSIYY